MTARRIVVAVLALASLTVGMYAQGGGGAAQGGGRRAAVVQAAVARWWRGREAGPPQPGHLMTGAWGERALTPDSRGWGWMVKQYVGKGPAAAVESGQGEAAQRRQGDERHHFELPTRDILRSAEALGLRLVRDAARDAVVRRSAEDDRGLPGREGCCADDPHA